MAGFNRPLGRGLRRREAPRRGPFGGRARAGREEMPRPLGEPAARRGGLGARQEGDGDGRGEGKVELGEGARRLQKPHKTRVDFDPRPRPLALRADRKTEAGRRGRGGGLQIRSSERLGSDKRLLLEHGGFRAAAQGHGQAQASGLDEPLRVQVRVPGERPPEGGKTAGFAAEMQRNREISRLDGRFSPTPCTRVI